MPACRSLIVFLASAISIAACGGGGGGSEKPLGGTPLPSVAPSPTSEPSPTTSPEPSGSPTPTTNPTPTPSVSAERLPNPNCLPPEPTVAGGGTLGASPAFPSLPVLGSPVAMVQLPGGDYLVATRDGRVLQFADDPAVNSFTTVLDIRDRVFDGGESGLLGLALHPNFASDRRIFLRYNDNQPSDPDAVGRNVLASFELNGSTGLVDPSSESILLTLDQISAFHLGGDLAFGDDGFLYASFGDSDAEVYAQNTTSLYGTILRLDVTNTDYAIPSDNPFAGNPRCTNGISGSGQNCPEIFAWGFRNPWRMSIDRNTGTLWVGDVGDDQFEEVNRVQLGGNYGWPVFEGNLCRNNTSACDNPDLLAPIHAYPHGGAASVVGGYVYRGDAIPSLNGRYIFGDIYQGEWFTLASDAGVGSAASLLFENLGTFFAMAENNAGELFFLTFTEEPGNNIFALSGGGELRYTMPESLSDTGCFDVQSKRSPSGVFDYDLNAPLWSDGALKRRAFAIPDGTFVGVDAEGDFEFPTDSILVKHFLNGDSFLETRLFVRHPSGWTGYSYEWNDAQSDAVLLTDGKQRDVGDFIHQYPARAQCLQCHTSAAKFSLGLELAQLNRFDDNRDANQIDYLSAAGYFDSEQSSNNSPRLVSLDDESASVSERARSYLHSNCSGCHRPGGPFSGLDLRFSTALRDTGACDVDPTRGNLGVAGAKRLAPGNPDASVLLLRMEASDETGERMPPLGTLDNDDAAIAIVREWISSINSCE